MQNDNVFNKRISTRLFVNFLVSLAVVILLIGTFLHYTSYTIVKNMVYQRAEVKIQLAYELLSHWIDEDSLAIKGFANYLSFQDLSKNKVADFITYESDKFEINLPYVAYLDGDFISKTWQPDAAYDVLKRPWFEESKSFFNNSSTWNQVYYSKPYISASNERTVITMTAPLHSSEMLIGFAALDVDIGELESRMATIDDVMGNWCVFSKDGDILVFGGKSDFVGSNINDHLMNIGFDDIVSALEKDNEVIKVFSTSQDAYFAIKDSVTGWVVAYRVNNDIIYSQVGLLNYGLLAGAMLLLVAFGIIISVLSSRFTKPIVMLAHSAEKIAHGDFNCYIDTNLRDELGYLTHSFNYMARELKDMKDYELQKAQLDSELRAAKSIQNSILPKDLLQSDKFSSYAFYSSAREIGGDFYDFFTVSDNCVVFCIGDVSGKGIPAALFMTMVCTLIRAVCSEEKNPARALERLNNTISDHNSECMFATVFLVYYNPLTGKCDYANAGHNSAFVLKKESVIKTPSLKGMLIGGFSGVSYTAGDFTLKAGDKVVLYTDGVTEAHSESGEVFSEERLQLLLQHNSDKSVTYIGDNIVKEVSAFQLSGQFDDITLLIWEHNGC